ncbi:related to ATP dependent RNA helicase [Cephalotrichum gorgonifer]|uniref:RNA helicase n=1 Tax=Cephalotrichum gorgonifer TaxID=2041049 RepID=A0AAE8MRG6_9PEZI|nr:related to ATP dependent RNA helicase [Cephalotrichum gorgonifer]
MSRFLRTTSAAYNGLAASTSASAPGVCPACWLGFFSNRPARPSLTPTTPTPPARHAPRRAFSGTSPRPGHVSMFAKMVDTRFRQTALSTKPWSEIEAELAPFGIKDMTQLRKEETAFKRAVSASFRKAEEGDRVEKDNSLFNALRLAFIRGDVKGLSTQLHFLFRNFLLRNRFSKPLTEVQSHLADLRYPWEWFPATRAIQRTIHLHVGPTNSGKTYHALQALENAKSGIYCGPLRLLAHEVYTRLTAKGKSCALLTGEEQRYPTDTDQYYISCTVEMAPMSQLFDVAVIDEIQMLSDPERGPSWTAALLGVQAKEVHLCGEERTVSLIQSICASIGDTCIVHRYQRLTPLKPASKAIGKKMQGLEKGDCIVAFSRVAIHAIKGNIERLTGRRCAIIYGSLPPETRSQQAALFNDPDNDYDFLVASDAIGMGLNLEIKRVIFESVTKHDGFDWRNLTISEVRQIGGRAGRYKSARQAIISSHTASTDSGEAAQAAAAQAEAERVGYVTTLDPVDLPMVQKNLWKEAKQITSAFIVPPVAYIEKFSTFFAPDTPLSFIFMRMRELATMSDRFQFTIKDSFLDLADLIQEFPISIYDRLVLVTAPVNLRTPSGRSILQAVTRCVAERRGGHILDIKEIHLELLDVDIETLPKAQGPTYLQNLEDLHHAVVLYLWMSYRFPRIFTAQGLGFRVRDLVQDKINQYLSSLNYTDNDIEGRRRHQRFLAMKRDKLQKDMLGEGAAEDVAIEEGPGRWNEEGHEEPLAQTPAELEELTRNVARSASGP